MTDKNEVRLVCISDTHEIVGWENDIPYGDILVHAGDCTRRGTLQEFESFLSKFKALPHPHKIFIAGNHDAILDKQKHILYSKEQQGLKIKPWNEIEKAHELIKNTPSVTYIENQSCEIAGLKFWGSPYVPRLNKKSFYGSPEFLAKNWSFIPIDVDILITHGPPFGILDVGGDFNEPLGCSELRLTLEYLISPLLHVFGHIHEAHGVQHINGTTFVNAAVCNKQHKLVFRPRIFDIDLKTRKVTEAFIN